MLDAIINNIQTQRAPSRSFEETLRAAERINWRIEDIISDDSALDFTKRFLPETLARVEALDFLNEAERRILNQIRAHAYLAIFGLVEEFILPFVLDHIRQSLDEDDYRIRAFLQFASEEAKHIQLFKRFSQAFQKDFGTNCAVIGPAAEIAAKVLAHAPLAVALLILHIEWMTQRHYVEMIKDNREIDAQFKSLLRHHWMEEVQHAKLDALMVEALADGMSEAEIKTAVDEYLGITSFLDVGLRQQAVFDLEAFERATGRTLTVGERDVFLSVQHQANRATYLGAGMSHSKFLETLGKLNTGQRKRIEKISAGFCQ